MNLTDAKRELLRSARAGNAVMMTSGSGLGKSSICREAFGELKAAGEAKGEKWGMGVIFAATQTPPDLIGFQFKGEKDYGDGKKITVTDPSVPLWMLSVPHGDDPGGKPAWMYDKFFLLIDEFLQGEADVKRACAEIFLNGGTAPWYLPPGSIRVGCTNKGARYGATKNFDFVLSRYTEISVEGNADVLLTYLDKPYVYQGRVWQTMPVTKAFVKAQPDVPFEPEPKEQGPWCNPRTLCSADRYLQMAAEDNGGVVPHEDPAVIQVLAGTIGMPATTALTQHLTFLTQLPKYEDVVADPTGTAIPQRADLMMLMAYQLAGFAKQEHLAECISYVQRMTKDMQVTFISALLRRDYKGLINTPAMQAWINKNAALVSIIASLGH